MSMDGRNGEGLVENDAGHSLYVAWGARVIGAVQVAVRIELSV